MLPEETALLVIDYQSAIIDAMGVPGTVVQGTARAVALARQAGIPVIFDMIGFRDHHPEVSARNMSFSMAKASGRFRLSDDATAVSDALGRGPDDVLVVKKRISAFSGSDLELVLRAQGRTHLVLCGLSTSGSLLSTVRQAADMDYEISVLADCCADRDEEVHRVLLAKVFPMQAQVIDLTGFEAALSTSSP